MMAGNLPRPRASLDLLASGEKMNREVLIGLLLATAAGAIGVAVALLANWMLPRFGRPGRLDFGLPCWWRCSAA
jgi:hypothetical protein